MATATQSTAPRAVTDGDTILATAVIPGSPELSFRALNTVEVEAWWGSPDTYHMKNWKADLQVGGRWSVDVMMGGAARPASGVFLEIDPPHRIVFTRRYEWDFPLLGWRDTKVTYRLKAERSGSRLIVRQDGFAHLGSGAEQHADGWERFLEFLITYFQKTRPSAAA